MNRDDKPSFDEIRERLGEMNPEAVLFDGFEDALIGIMSRFGSKPLALYDRERCIQILMSRDGMSREDAEELFQYDTEGCWAGDGTPAFAILGPNLDEPEPEGAVEREGDESDLLREVLYWCRQDASNEDGHPSQTMLDARVVLLEEALCRLGVSDD